MIYLLRHGLDDEHYVGGWSDASLTDIGRKQVIDAIPHIQKLPIKHIITSDIKRAVETAEIVSSGLLVDVKPDPRFRELNKGVLTGVETRFARSLYPKYGRFTVYDRYPMGESMLDLYYRVRDLLGTLQEMEDTLLITHRGVINMLYYLLTDTPLDMDKEKFNVAHASIHESDIKEKYIRRIY